MATTGVYQNKLDLNVSARRMWKAAFEDMQSVLPRAVPDAVDRIEYSGTKNEVGSVCTIHFHRSYAEKTCKESKAKQLVMLTREKVLEVDPRALTLKLDIIEGGLVGTLVKRYRGTFWIQETGPTTSTIHFTFEYEALSEQHKPYVPVALDNIVPRSFLTIQAFLLSHPDCV